MMINQILTCLATGALLLAAIYYTVINFRAYDDMLKKYCRYLSASLAYMATFGYLVFTDNYALGPQSLIVIDMLFLTLVTCYLQFISAALL
jgi:hypothetical protein